MRGIGTVLWALVLGVALAAAPIPIEPDPLGSDSRWMPPPAEVDERPADSEIEERSRGDAKPDPSFAPPNIACSPADRSFLYAVLPVPRKDDPTGALIHGLRAPPA